MLINFGLINLITKSPNHIQLLQKPVNCFDIQQVRGAAKKAFGIQNAFFDCRLWITRLDDTRFYTRS